MRILSPRICRKNQQVLLMAMCLVCHLPIGHDRQGFAQEVGNSSSTNSGRSRSSKLVLAHYMPWYVTQPSYGMHWTGPGKEHDPDQVGADGLPDIWSHYHPLIGLYDSSDPDVIECQLLQMKLAGIDGVIVDWYGISQAADYSKSHEATIAVFEMTKKLGMQFVVCFEDRTIQYQVERKLLQETEIEQHLSETMAWLQENWFQSPHYVALDDRPLLLNFGPIFVKDANIWKRAFEKLPVRPKFYALQHLWKKVGADGGFTWANAKVWEDRPRKSEIQKRLTRMYQKVSDKPQEIIASALPGFRDVYEKHYPVIDHRDGETLKESLTAAMRGSWPIVQLVTWNDYGEGTMIEPTHEFGYEFLEIVQTIHRKQLGQTIRVSTEDLRLPAKLLDLRVSKTVVQKDLDHISDLLSNGDTHTARVLLEQLTSSNIERNRLNQISMYLGEISLSNPVF